MTREAAPAITTSALRVRWHAAVARQGASTARLWRLRVGRAAAGGKDAARTIASSTDSSPAAPSRAGSAATTTRLDGSLPASGRLARLAATPKAPTFLCLRRVVEVTCPRAAYGTRGPSASHATVSSACPSTTRLEPER